MKAEHLKCEVCEDVVRKPAAWLGGQQCGSGPNGVMVTHIPTGLVAFCDTQRSQLKNRDVAKAMIEYGLAEVGWEDPK